MPQRQRALSSPAIAVLLALSDGVAYGFDIMDATGLASGTVYPILARLESRGLAESHWEDPQAHRAEGRPARKYYRITGAGRRELATGLERIRALGVRVPRLA